MFRNSTYLQNLFKIALPIIAQNFVGSLLNMIDITMIGQLGETAVAAVGLANQIFFLMLLMMFGINGGAGVFVAQFWGKKDVASIRKVQGISLGMGIGAGLLFSVVALVFPEAALGVYTRDPAVISSGGAFLRTVGWSYLATAVTLSYSSVLRGIGMVRIPMAVSITAISLKTALNFGLIFGNFGLPEMGIQGAAIATVISRLIEFCAILLITYVRKLPPAANLRELVAGYNRMFLPVVLRTSFPVVVNETLWSLGNTVYNIVYARIGTEAIAAVNIAFTIEGMAFVIFIGISEATGILIGNRIGAGEEEEAYTYARRTLFLSIGGAIFMGGVIFLISGYLLGFYQISEVARTNAQNVLYVMSFSLWIKVTNMSLIIGILRAGGDTRFGLVLDAGSVWLVGVPLAVFGSMVLHFPVHYVYLMVVGEEFVKLLVAFWRYSSRRWMRNLTRAVPQT